MAGLIFLFFVTSFLFFVGTFHYMKLANTTNSYPPKRVLRQRAFLLATGGVVSMLFGLIFYYVQ
ncbi:hypothetical protein [Bacillus alveayuensis]|uniref:hypothetical protein n=1 Tax=Aeribacillus alveayuensis TaxID=279215 RepID=UPI0005D11696|nr:hypothetical protein [Bacillus alveayuensis]